jgi:hypothetical protein
MSWSVDRTDLGRRGTGDERHVSILGREQPLDQVFPPQPLPVGCRLAPAVVTVHSLVAECCNLSHNGRLPTPDIPVSRTRLIVPLSTSATLRRQETNMQLTSGGRGIRSRGAS